MGCFCMPKGQRKYNGTQKVEIIERIRSEQLSFHEASREYDFPDEHFKTGNESIWKKEKKLFW